MAKKRDQTWVLAINGGSSSIKFALFEAGDSLRRILVELSALETLVFASDIEENVRTVRTPDLR